MLKREVAALQETKEKTEVFVCVFFLSDVGQLQARGVGSGKEQVLQNSNQGLDNILPALRNILHALGQASPSQARFFLQAPPIAIPHTHPVLRCNESSYAVLLSLSIFVCITLFLSKFELQKNLM